ncbi:unnamed protein product, partial [Heterotrigona itama]
YALEWYNLPLSIQKVLLFVMQGNRKPVLTFYGIWELTFETLSK